MRTNRECDNSFDKINRKYRFFQSNSARVHCIKIVPNWVWIPWIDLIPFRSHITGHFDVLFHILRAILDITISYQKQSRVKMSPRARNSKGRHCKFDIFLQCTTATRQTAGFPDMKLLPGDKTCNTRRTCLFHIPTWTRAMKIGNNNTSYISWPFNESDIYVSTQHAFNYNSRTSQDHRSKILKSCY